MENRELSGIIRKLYALTLSNDELQALLARIIELVRCRSLGLQIIDRDNLHLLSEMNCKADHVDYQHYAEHFDQLKPYLAYMREAESCSEAREFYCFNGVNLRRLEHAADLLATDHEILPIFSLIMREGSYLIQMAFIGVKDHETLYKRILRMSALLRPHIHAAFEIFHAIESLRNHSEGYMKALDQLQAGVILFDGNGCAVYVNKRARVLVASTPGLTMVGSGILGGSAELTNKLRQMIRNAIHAGMEGESEIRVISLPIADAGQGMLSVVAVPLHPDIRALVELESGIYAALLIGIFDKSPWMDADLLQLMYGLTPAEARLAISLATGKSMDECRQETGITMHTARSYLKIIFQKTNTRRQAEMVALLRSIPISTE